MNRQASLLLSRALRPVSAGPRSCTVLPIASPSTRLACAPGKRSISYARTFDDTSSRGTRNTAVWKLAGSAALVSALLFASPVFAEEQANGSKSSKVPLTKEQIGIVCVIGGPSSGKSTQVANIKKRFGLQEIEASEDTAAALQKAIESAPTGKKPRVVIEGFPKTIEQSDNFEKTICPILLIIFIDLESKKAVERIQDEVNKRDAKINWKRFEDKSEPVIKKFRFQGNILEITGEWPADEVWEQVEAKLESALELDDRGEL